MPITTTCICQGGPTSEGASEGIVDLSLDAVEEVLTDRDWALLSLETIELLFGMAT
jgi:hypothetical protein